MYAVPTYLVVFKERCSRARRFRQFLSKQANVNNAHFDVQDTLLHFRSFRKGLADFIDDDSCGSVASRVCYQPSSGE